MNSKKQISYSIFDAFKSLESMEDEKVVTVDEVVPKTRVLSEDIDKHVAEDDETKSEIDLDEIDKQIEALNKHLVELKEKFDKDPELLTNAELKELTEAGLIETDKTVIKEDKINLMSKKEVEKGLDELEKVKEQEDVEMVVDVEAETMDELKDSYVDNFILQCPVCKTLIYKEQSEVIYDEEDKETVNVGEACPHCKSEDGFTIVGKVAPVTKEEEKEVEHEEEKEDKEKKDESLEEDVNIESFNDVLFDKLATKYLNNIYENVDNFKTISGTLNEDSNKIKIEGVINFKSGKKTNTTFVFEAHSITKKGRVRFVGMNEALSKSKRTFTLVGKVNGDELLPESLTYNYSVRVNEELKRIYGRVVEDITKIK